MEYEVKDRVLAFSSFEDPTNIKIRTYADKVKLHIGQREYVWDKESGELDFSSGYPSRNKLDESKTYDELVEEIYRKGLSDFWGGDGATISLPKALYEANRQWYWTVVNSQSVDYPPYGGFYPETESPVSSFGAIAQAIDHLRREMKRLTNLSFPYNPENTLMETLTCEEFDKILEHIRHITEELKRVKFVSELPQEDNSYTIKEETRILLEAWNSADEEARKVLLEKVYQQEQPSRKHKKRHEKE